MYCPANSLACGNGASRTMHPVELFGEDWDTFNATGGEQAESENPEHQLKQ